MAALTFEQLIRAVQDDLDDRKERQWKVREIKRWLNEGYRMVWKEVLQLDEHYAAVEETFTYPSTTRALVLEDQAGVSADVYKIHAAFDMTDDASGAGTLLHPVKYIDQQNLAQRTSNPHAPTRDERGYFFFGDPMQFGIVPRPFDSMTIRLLVTHNITAMTAVGSVPAGVPDDCHEAIVAYAVKMARAKVHEATDVDERRWRELTASNRRSAESRQRQTSRHVHQVDPSDYDDYSGPVGDYYL